MTREEKSRRFNRILFSWHRTHYRPMAWRNTRDPYRILVSEVMLQQTQVDRVRKKYAQFIKKFPTVHSLARESLGDVLRVWSGLGYNRRAKYLHNCAREIVVRYGGAFPQDESALRALPGIGISTAAAIRTFAFDFDEPMIDTNIRRILVRTFFKKNTPSDIELFEFATRIIPKGKGREWNYAMLDLGAIMCTARNHSYNCPLNSLHGTVGDFIYKKSQKKFKNSMRYYRGRIIALLSETQTLSKIALAKRSRIDAQRIGQILKVLMREGMIKKSDDKYFLP